MRYFPKMDGEYRKKDVRPAFRVGIVAVPGFALLSYASTVEPLRAANLLSARKLYQITHFAREGTAQSSGGAMVPAGARLDGTPALDLLVVVAGGRPEAYRDPVLFAWLRRMAARGVPLAGVSGGPVLLARAGLMAGRRMTVHWEHAPALAEIAPDLLLERSLYVIDRDRMTCGGGTAPLDMMHALITTAHGAAFARSVSDWFLHTDVRASGAPQRAGLEARLGTVSPPVLAAVGVMQSHLADPLSLSQLAEISGVSPRQLNRLFRDRLGQSTMGYYRALRLALAVRLLQDTALSVTEIALTTGFAGSAHFSAAFSQALGRTPLQMRRAGLPAAGNNTGFLPEIG